jgi:hypothetical protein
MRGCLFTLLLGGVAIALIVLIGLPQVAAGALTSAVTAAGLEADDTTVTVSSDPPTDLLGLKADRVRIRATDATFRGLQIGALDLELGGVAILDRTADTIDGRLTDVVIENIGGRELALGAITVAGGGDEITATTTVPGADVERLIADAAEPINGSRPKSVTLTAPNRVTVDFGFDVEGTLDVNGSGDLVVIVPDSPLAGGEIVLLRGGEDLPIRLTGVRVTEDGDLRLAGDLEIGILG